VKKGGGPICVYKVLGLFGCTSIFLCFYLSLIFFAKGGRQ
jgi:hypothetical protein